MPLFYHISFFILSYSFITIGFILQSHFVLRLLGIPIFHSSEFVKKMKEYDVHIGVLTVPIEIAQQITDTMIAGGIKAVWNFTPFRIRVPENIVVQNTSLYAHLAVMFNRLNFNEH